MFDIGVELTVVLTAVGLWFAHAWYLNTRLAQVHQKLDRVLERFDRLRNYLYEIDPQFDDERKLSQALSESVGKGTMSADGRNLMELTQRKEAAGQRTLKTPL